MSGYGIHDVPTLKLEESSISMLEKSDSTQGLLMSEAVIQVTENGFIQEQVY